MTQSESLDLPTLSRRLAEMERECPYQHNIGDGHAFVQWEKHRCEGTGRIVPFAVLRRVSQGGGRWSHQNCVERNFCELTVLSNLEIRDCEGRGWVAEPDPLRAFALAVLKGPWVEVHCWKGGTGLWFFTVRDAAGCAGHGDDPIADYAFWRAVQEWEKGEAADA